MTAQVIELARRRPVAEPLLPEGEPTLDEQIRAVRGALEAFHWIAPVLHLDARDAAAHRRRLEAAIASLEGHRQGGAA